MSICIPLAGRSETSETRENYLSGELLGGHEENDVSPVGTLKLSRCAAAEAAELKPGSSHPSLRPHPSRFLDSKRIYVNRFAAKVNFHRVKTLPRRNSHRPPVVLRQILRQITFVESSREIDTYLHGIDSDNILSRVVELIRNASPTLETIENEFRSTAARRA